MLKNTPARKSTPQPVVTKLSYAFTHTGEICHDLHCRWPELRFVTTVAIGGCVKFVPAVKIFLEINAFSCIIFVEVQDLHTHSVILHLHCFILSKNSHYLRTFSV